MLEETQREAMHRLLVALRGEFHWDATRNSPSESAERCEKLSLSRMCTANVVSLRPPAKPERLPLPLTNIVEHTM